MKQIVYIHNMRFPTEKAHGYQIAKMCEALALAGVPVELLLPRRKNDIQQDAFVYYGIKPSFRITFVKFVDFLSWRWLYQKIGFVLNGFEFMVLLFLKQIDKGDIIYTRSPELAWIFRLRGYKTFFECHQLPHGQTGLFSFLIKKLSGIITITHGLKKDIIKKYGFNETRILVAPDGVDLKTFDIQLTRQEARQKLNLPLDKKIILYTGQLFAWKGVDILAEATSSLPNDYLVYLVGGTKDDTATFKSKYQSIKNLICLPSVPRDEVAIWLKAADVLALPNSGRFQISERYTSPLKLFEYMASGTPILASDLPSLREILDENEAFFSKPDDPVSLAQTINKIVSEKDDAKRRADTTHGMVDRYTWHGRAKTITNFIEKFL